MVNPPGWGKQIFEDEISGYHRDRRNTIKYTYPVAYGQSALNSRLRRKAYREKNFLKKELFRSPSLLTEFNCYM